MKHRNKRIIHHRGLTFAVGWDSQRKAWCMRHEKYHMAQLQLPAENVDEARLTFQGLLEEGYRSREQLDKAIADMKARGRR